MQEGNINTQFEGATQLLLWISRIRFCWHFLHRFTCSEASVPRIRLGWSGREVQRCRKKMGEVLTDLCHEPIPTSPFPFRQKQTSQVCLFKGSTWLFLSPNWRAKEIGCRGVTAVKKSPLSDTFLSHMLYLNQSETPRETLIAMLRCPKWGKNRTS